LEYKKSTNYILSFICAKDIHLKSHQYFHASVLEKKEKKRVAEIGAAKSMLNLQIS
jgi:negative regulator of sigma E activity